MTTARIENAEPSEIEAVMGLMTLAFSSDPVMRWLYPDAHAYLKHFPRFTRAFGGVAFEHDTAWSTSCSGGASLWLPPGVHPDQEAIGGVVGETVGKTLHDQTFELLEEMDKYHPTEPHWYLAVIGVDPARRGKGLGAALLQKTLATVDEQALPAYLESSNPANISLYERHGFEVMGEIKGDGPLVTPMYRSAR